MKSEDLKQIVKEKYGKIAASKGEEKGSCCSPSCCGDGEVYSVFSEDYVNREGYNPDADLNLGCGIPTEYAGIKKGDHVLDLGSGAGNDCFVARAIVGEEGSVTGLDFTEEMIAKAEENCRKLNLSNVRFIRGDIEEMPLPDNSFDVVISNCVLNLVPDKKKAFSGINRVLKPGGRFCVSDVVLKGNLPEGLKHDSEMYAGCVSGASEIETYLAIIRNSGFVDQQIHKQKAITIPETVLSQYLSGEDLENFNRTEGIFSITVSARKPDFPE